MQEMFFNYWGQFCDRLWSLDKDTLLSYFENIISGSHLLLNNSPLVKYKSILKVNKSFYIELDVNSKTVLLSFLPCFNLSNKISSVGLLLNRNFEQDLGLPEDSIPFLFIVSGPALYPMSASEIRCIKQNVLLYLWLMNKQVKDFFDCSAQHRRAIDRFKQDLEELLLAKGLPSPKGRPSSEGLSNAKGLLNSKGLSQAQSEIKLERVLICLGNAEVDVVVDDTSDYLIFKRLAVSAGTSFPDKLLNELIPPRPTVHPLRTRSLSNKLQPSILQQKNLQQNPFLEVMPLDATSHKIMIQFEFSDGLIAHHCEVMRGDHFKAIELIFPNFFKIHSFNNALAFYGFDTSQDIRSAYHNEEQGMNSSWFKLGFLFPLELIMKYSSTFSKIPTYLVDGFSSKKNRMGLRLSSVRWGFYENNKRPFDSFIDNRVTPLKLNLEAEICDASLLHRPDVFSAVEDYVKLKGLCALKLRAKHIAADSADEAQVFSYFSIHAKEKILEFTNYCVLQNFLSVGGGPPQSYLASQPWLDNSSLEHIIYGVESIQKKIYEISSSKVFGQAYSLEKPSLDEVLASDVSLAIQVNQKIFKLITHFKIGERLVSCTNMAAKLKAMLTGFDYSEDYIKKLFGVDNDLNIEAKLLFQHRGIRNVMLLECFSYLLYKESSEGFKFISEGDFRANLIKKIEFIDGRNFTDGDRELSKSQAVGYLTGLNQLIDKLTDVKLFNGILFIDGELVLVKNIYRPQIELVLCVFKNLAKLAKKSFILPGSYKSNIEILIDWEATTTPHNLKYRDEFIDEHVTAVGAKPLNCFLQSYYFGWGSEESQFLTSEGWAAIALSHPAFNVCIDGKNIVFLNADRLKIELKLLDAKSLESKSLADNGLAANGLAANSLEDSEKTFVKTKAAVDEKDYIVNRSSLDWFELHPLYFLDGKPISEEDIKKLATGNVLLHNGEYFVLDPRKFPMAKTLCLFWEKLRGAPAKSTSLYKSQEAPVNISRHPTLDLLALRASGMPIIGNEKWQKICEYFDALSLPRKELEVSESLKGVLKPYQKIGIAWLYDLFSLELGGILADDMGLGKTLQVLGFLSLLKTKGQLGRTLIVVPTSLTFNWQQEAKKFTPDLELLSFEPKKESMLERNDVIHLCSYGLFISNADLFNKYQWDLLILDEAQAIKSNTTQRYQKLSELRARIKFCITGTPFENHLGELYSLLNFTIAGCLGEKEEFKSRYVNPKQILKSDIDFLKLKVRPLVLRRKKDELLTELPAKIETVLTIPFSAQQKKIYREIALSWNTKIKESVVKVGEAKSQILMLTALLRLRQACSDPSAIPAVKYKELPPKIENLIERICEVIEEGHSVIVFTQFLATFARIAKELDSLKQKYYTINGGTSRKMREQNLAEFTSAPEPGVMLMTLKTGGVGLNLTKASYVFHIEPWWNPAVEQQATDRAHRMGQQKSVQVIKYIMQDSVEEKIQTLKSRKSILFNQMLDCEIESELISNSVEGSTEQTVSESMKIEEHSTKGAISQKDFEYLIS